MSISLVKDASIWRLLAELSSHLDMETMRVVDHWEDDRCAIGIERADNTGGLVYVLTHGRRAGHCAYICEPPGDPAGIVEKHEDAPFELLLSAIRRHLGISAVRD